LEKKKKISTTKIIHLKPSSFFQDGQQGKGGAPGKP
jgi:hypothetical protein